MFTNVYGSLMNFFFFLGWELLLGRDLLLHIFTRPGCWKSPLSLLSFLSYFCDGGGFSVFSVCQGKRMIIKKNKFGGQWL